MSDSTQFTSRATVISLVYIDGEPHLYHWHLSTNKSGTRHIYGASRIKDKGLLRRVKSELARDDEIELVTMNNPRGQGTILVDFKKLNESPGERRPDEHIWPSAEKRLSFLDRLRRR